MAEDLLKRRTRELEQAEAAVAQNRASAPVIAPEDSAKYQRLLQERDRAAQAVRDIQDSITGGTATQQQQALIDAARKQADAARQAADSFARKAARRGVTPTQLRLDPALTGISQNIKNAVELANKNLMRTAADQIKNAQEVLLKRIGQLEGSKKPLDAGDQQLLQTLKTAEARLSGELDRRMQTMVDRQMARLRQNIASVQGLGEAVTAGRGRYTGSTFTPRQLQIMGQRGGPDAIARATEEQLQRRMAAVAEGAERALRALQTDPGNTQLQQELRDLVTLSGHLTDALKDQANRTNDEIRETTERLRRQGAGPGGGGRPPADRTRLAGPGGSPQGVGGYVSQAGIAAEAVFRGDWLQRTIETTGAMWMRGIAATLAYSVQNAVAQGFQSAIQTEQTGLRVMATLKAQAELGAQEAGATTGKSFMESFGQAAQDIPVIGGLFTGLEFTAQKQALTELRDIAVATGQPLDDVFQSAAQLAGLFQGADLFGAVKMTQQLTVISQGALNATEAFRTLGAVTTAFGLEGTDGLQRFGDAAVRLQEIVGSNIEDTAEGVARLGAAAEALGFSFEETMSLVAVTTKLTGQSGQVIGEQLGRIMSALQTPRAQQEILLAVSPESRTGLQRAFQEDTGAAFRYLIQKQNELSTAERSRIAKIIGGERQFATAAALFGPGLESLAQTTNLAAESTGALEKRYADFMTTVGQRIEQFKSSFSGLISALGESGVFAGFAAIIGSFVALVEGLRRSVEFVNRLTDALGPFAVILKALVALFATLAAFKLGAGLVQRFQSAAIDRRAGFGIAGQSREQIIARSPNISEAGANRVNIAYRNAIRDWLKKFFTGIESQARTVPPPIVPRIAPGYIAPGARGAPAGAPGAAAVTGPAIPRAQIALATQAQTAQVRAGAAAFGRAALAMQVSASGVARADMRSAEASRIEAEASLRAARATNLFSAALTRAGTMTRSAGLGMANLAKGVGSSIVGFLAFDAVLALGMGVWTRWQDDMKKTAEFNKKVREEAVKGAGVTPEEFKQVLEEAVGKREGQAISPADLAKMDVTGLSQEIRNRNLGTDNSVVSNDNRTFSTQISGATAAGLGPSRVAGLTAVPRGKKNVMNIAGTEIDLDVLKARDEELYNQFVDNEDKIADFLRRRSVGNIEKTPDPTHGGFKFTPGMAPAVGYTSKEQEAARTLRDIDDLQQLYIKKRAEAVAVFVSQLEAARGRGDIETAVNLQQKISQGNG